MFLICTLLAIMPLEEVRDTVVHDIAAVTVTAPMIKHNGDFHEQPLSVSTFSGAFIEANRVAETKDLSFTVPNFVQADYGSKMTSSIYVRGIGSRMDQPSVGLYLDNIPILNKNNFDFDYYDIRNIYFLRGPQGTLYGRNTIAGVIDVHTLSPWVYQGTNLYGGYGNGNTSEAKFSTYHKPSENFAFSFSLNHKYSDGFFTNEFNGTSADRILSEGGSWKSVFRLNSRWMLENTLFANYVDQKGFAYGLYDEKTGTVSDVNYNDPSSYERFNLTDGLTFRYAGDHFSFSSTTSYQYMDDEMILDQDFSPASLFTLTQTQKEHGFTQEFVLRSRDEGRWQWITGAFGFYRHLKMEAPVTFKRDGIDELILKNANDGIHTVFPNANLLIREDSFPIESDFKLPVYGMSLYHQSTYGIGKWKLTAGIRADYEHTSIRYDSKTAVHYRFDMMMPDFKLLPAGMEGRENKSYFEFMPLVSATYDTPVGTFYASATRGYKAGGYNTQIFSDITQNLLMTEMMADLGFPGGGGEDYDVNKAVSYDPEYSWNYEIGGHLSFLDEKLNLDFSLFYIDIRDQQLTVFPPGKNTGRLMSNAGHSRSFGTEISLSYRYRNFFIAGNYGHTNAKFKDYDTGKADYSDHYVPYIPKNTLSFTGEYRWPINRKLNHILFNVNWSGAGSFYWDEANTLSQSFYSLLNASVTFQWDKYSLGVWGKNLTDTDFNTFYFKSVGKSFVQRGKPVQFGVYARINL